MFDLEPVLKGNLNTFIFELVMTKAARPWYENGPF